MNRRESLKLLSTASLAAGFTWTFEDVKTTQEKMARPGTQEPSTPYVAEFFTPHELRTVNVLVDIIIPADDRSGSATDAGVPEFMDFMLIDRPTMQLPMRGGLAWMDYQSQKRFGEDFVDCSTEQQLSLVDEIAWPDQAAPEVSQGVSFFNSFRDLTASGFWSSKTGVDDLQYIGNAFVPEWKGCPDEILEELGVSYDDE